MIIDDNCYLNGESVRFNVNKPYIIIIGERAIGKGVYAKAMSNINTMIQYVTFQNINRIEKIIKSYAIKIIEIKSIK